TRCEYIKGENIVRDSELKALADEATPRPWVFEPGDYEDNGDGILRQYEGAHLDPVFTIDCGEFFGLSNCDAEFIVAACNEVPRLLDEKAALEKRVADLREALKELSHYDG